MKTAVYDNPSTMCRESWQDCKLLYRYYFAALEEIPSYLYFFGANIGKWKAGQIIGDVGAIAPSEVSE